MYKIGLLFAAALAIALTTSAGGAFAQTIDKAKIGKGESTDKEFKSKFGKSESADKDFKSKTSDGTKSGGIDPKNSKLGESIDSGFKPVGNPATGGIKTKP